MAITKKSTTLLTVLTLLALACQRSEGNFQPGDVPAPASLHRTWATVLEKHHREGGMDYGGLAADPAELNAYLTELSSQTVEGWSDDAALAFWINAYNAVVVHQVIQRYPKIDSVKDIDGVFDEITYPIAGEDLTLNAIESRCRDLGGARVHFAVVCASESCPDLQSQPFEAATLEPQLAAAVASFLDDRNKGMRFDETTNTLWLSSIFKWYAGDFTGGSTVVAFFARGGVVDWVVQHLPHELSRELRAKRPKVRYLDYDWSLNDRS